MDTKTVIIMLAVVGIGAVVLYQMRGTGELPATDSETSGGRLSRGERAALGIETVGTVFNGILSAVQGNRSVAERRGGTPPGAYGAQPGSK